VIIARTTGTLLQKHEVDSEQDNGRGFRSMGSYSDGWRRTTRDARATGEEAVRRRQSLERELSGFA
jgi:hypothetical protein